MTKKELKQFIEGTEKRRNNLFYILSTLFRDDINSENGTDKNYELHLETPSDDLESEEFVIDEILSKQFSKALYVVSESFLRESSETLRKKIVEEDITDVVILISAQWINPNLDKAKKVALLHFNRKKKRPSAIKLIDATYDCGNNSGDSEDVDGLLIGQSVANIIALDVFSGEEYLLYKDSGQETYCDYFSEYMRIVGNPEISSKGFSLDPDSYLDRIRPADGYHLIELMDTSSQYKKSEKTVKGLIIKQQNLKNSKTHYTLDVDSLGDEEVSGVYWQIKERSLIISRKGNCFCPTIINPEEKPVYANLDDVCIIREDSNYCLDYIVSELVQQKEYVNYQQRLWQNGRLPYLRILVPNGCDEKDSYDLQQIISIRSRFVDVCKYYPGDELVELLKMLSNENITTSITVANIVRKILSWVMLQLNDMCILPIKPNKKVTDLGVCSRFLRFCQLNKCKIPVYIRECFYSCAKLANVGSHIDSDETIKKTETESIIINGYAPYLNTMLIYQLLNILQWCSIKKSENKKDNQRMKWKNESVDALTIFYDKELGKFEKFSEDGKKANFERKELELAYNKQ